MRKIRYFGIYSGPSYFGGDDEWVMGFASFGEARRTFLDFYGGTVSYDSFRKNADGLYVMWEEVFSRTPGTSESDFMDVFPAIPDELGQYARGEDFIRFSLGPRGGVVREA